MPQDVRIILAIGFVAFAVFVIRGARPADRSAAFDDGAPPAPPILAPAGVDLSGLRISAIPWTRDGDPGGYLVRTGDRAFDSAGYWWATDPGVALAWLDADRRARWVEIRNRCHAKGRAGRVSVDDH